MQQSTAVLECVIARCRRGGRRALCCHARAACLTLRCWQVDHVKQAEHWKLVEAARVIYSAGFFITVSPESIKLVAKHCSDSGKMYCMNLSAPFISQVSSPAPEQCPGLHTSQPGCRYQGCVCVARRKPSADSDPGCMETAAADRLTAHFQVPCVWGLSQVMACAVPHTHTSGTCRHALGGREATRRSAGAGDAASRATGATPDGPPAGV